MKDISSESAARERTEKALVESEERFRQTSERLAKVLDSSLDVICTFDAEGRFTQVSAACERMWGYRQEELLGTPFLNLVHPDDRAKTRAVDAKILAGSPTINFENRYLRKDGSVVDMRWSAWWSEEDQSNFCVAHDNTETRKAEAETRDLAERLSETLESITDGFFTIDRDWRFTYLNGEAARLFRREREAVLGQIAWDVFPEAVGTGFQREYARSLAENVPVQFEEFYPTNRWFEVRAYPSARGLAVYFRDVSEQHSAREALQVSEEHYRLMFEQTSIAKTITALDFTFVRANAAFLRLVGYSMEELATMDFLAITHPDDVAQNIEGARRLTAGEIDHHEVDKRYLRKDGRWIWVHVSVCLLKNAADQPQSYLASIVDIDDRKKAELDAERAAATQAAIIRTQQEIAGLDLDLQAVMDLLAERARTLVGATGGMIELVEDRETVYRAVAGVSAEHLGTRLQRDDSLSGLAVRSGEAQLCDDAELDDRVDLAACRKLGLRSMVVVPLRAGEKIIGVLKVLSDQPHAFTAADVRNLQILVESAGVVIERHRIQVAVREQAALLDNARDAILVRDLERRITYWNRSAERLYGWTAEEMMGKVAAEVTFKDWQPLWKAEQQLALNGEWIGEFQQVARDGRELTVESRWTLMRDDAGQPKSVLVINTDVTERKRQQEAFLITAKRTELAAKASKVGIWDWDVTRGTTHWDEQMFALYGEDPAIGQNGFEIWRRHLHPDDLERAHAELAESMRSEGTAPDGFSFRIIVPAPDGDIRHIRGELIIFRDATGQPTRVLGTNWDVTTQVRREETLRQKLEEEKVLRLQAIAGEKAKREFLAVMSHEIRTPMHGVLGFAEMLLHSPTLTPENRDLSQTIVSSGEALLRILDDILDFSRIEAGRLAIEKRPFSLRELLENIRLLFLKRIQEKKLTFVVSVDDGLPVSLVGDVGRIRQILVNLIGNALKFTEHGSIQVNVRRPLEADAGEWVEFVVADTGPGVAPERVEAIFEAFTQADSSISRRHGGTGLGLTVSRRLAELMGGRLRMASELGKGTTFTALVPLVPASASTNAAPAVDGPACPVDGDFAARHPLRVLVVEDDQVNLKLIVGVLRKLGYSPLAARNGVEAVAIYELENIDCVFMDMQMPEMDGMEATQRIRAWEQIHAIRPAYVSALTANILPEDQQRCFEAGMNFYLNKPVKRQAIADVLIEASKLRGVGAD